MHSPSPRAAALILCEATSRWSIAWKRALRDSSIEIVETRALAQCAAELAARPGSIVGIEMTTDNLPRLYAPFIALRQSFLAVPWLALTDRELQPVEAELRDAGFVHLLYSRREVPAAARLVLQQLR